MELPGAILRAPTAAEARQMPADLGKGDAIAAVVGAGRAEAQAATRKSLRDDFGDLAYAVVLLVVADIHDLGVHGVARCVERERDRLADILRMDERPPRRS